MTEVREAMTKTERDGIPLFDTTEVVISTPGGTRTVTGLIHPWIPGLAVTSNHFGVFDVSHLATGGTVVRGYARMWNAARCMTSLSRVCEDWTLDKDGLKAYLLDRGDEPAPSAPVIASEWHPTRKQLLDLLRNHIAQDEFPWEGPDTPEAAAWALLETIKSERAAAR